MSILKSFCLKAGGLRTYIATTFYLLRKISYGFFSILAALKPDSPKVAYVSTGGNASISFCNFLLFRCACTRVIIMYLLVIIISLFAIRDPVKLRTGG